jgi:hypothetical protein
MEGPLGRAVIGGLVLSTVCTLLVVPAIFAVVIGNRKARSPSLSPEHSESPHYDPDLYAQPEATTAPQVASAPASEGRDSAQPEAATAPQAAPAPGSEGREGAYFDPDLHAQPEAGDAPQADTAPGNPTSPTDPPPEVQR